MVMGEDEDGVRIDEDGVVVLGGEEVQGILV